MCDSTIDIGTPEGRRNAIELSREAQLPFAIYLDGRMRKINFNSPIERIDREPVDAPATAPQAVPIEVSMVIPAAIRKRHSVEVKRVLSDFRVNRTVPSGDNEAMEAGAMLDGANGIMYILYCHAWICCRCSSGCRSISVITSGAR